MKNILPFVLVSFLSMHFGCTGNDSAEQSVTGTEMPMARSEANSDTMKMSENEESADNSSVETERKIIKTGFLNYETKDLNATHNKIVEVTMKNGGYIANESINKQYDRVSRSLTVRVPAEKFDHLLAEISAGVEFFDQKNISVSDVTTQHIDLTARLKTKQELESRYLALLTKADKVQDILEIERQAALLREEIESVQGQLKYLNDQVGYSTLNVEFYVMTRDMPGFSGQFGQSLHDGWQNLLSFIVFAVKLWPFIILAIGFVFFVRRMAKRNSKPKA